TATGGAALLHGHPALLATFSHTELFQAAAHHTLLRLATGHARVPELLAIGPLGVVKAAKVLSIALEKLLGCVRALAHKELLPGGWALTPGCLADVALRTSAAADEAPRGAWGMAQVVQRFMFECGQEVSFALHEADASSRDVLSRVLLFTMGRELGALLTGKFDNVLKDQPSIRWAPSPVHPAASKLDDTAPSQTEASQDAADQASNQAHAAPIFEPAVAVAFLEGGPSSGDATASSKAGLPGPKDLPGSRLRNVTLGADLQAQSGAAFTSSDNTPAKGPSTGPGPSSSTEKPKGIVLDTASVSQSGHAGHTSHASAGDWQRRTEQLQAEEEAEELASLWRGYATDSEGPSMTALRVALVGKVAPRDIDKLLAIARGDFLAQQALASVRMNAAHPSESQASQPAQQQEQQEELDGKDAGQRKHPRRLRREAIPTSSADEVAPGTATQRHSCVEDLEPSEETMQPEQPLWLTMLPVPQPRLAPRLLQLTGLPIQPPGLGRRTAPELSLYLELTATASVTQGPHQQQQRGQQGRSPRMFVDGATGELCFSALARWELAPFVALAGQRLASASFELGGNLLLVGPNPHALRCVAQLAAVSVDATVLSLPAPSLASTSSAEEVAKCAGALAGRQAHIVGMSCTASGKPTSRRAALLSLLLAALMPDVEPAPQAPAQGDAMLSRFTSLSTLPADQQLGNQQAQSPHPGTTGSGASQGAHEDQAPGACHPYQGPAYLVDTQVPVVPTLTAASNPVASRSASHATRAEARRSRRIQNRRHSGIDSDGEASTGGSGSDSGHSSTSSSSTASLENISVVPAACSTSPKPKPASWAEQQNKPIQRPLSTSPKSAISSKLSGVQQGRDASASPHTTSASTQMPAGPSTQRFVLLLGPEDVTDAGVLELLQQLLVWPAALAPLGGGRTQREEAHSFQAHVCQLMSSETGTNSLAPAGLNGRGSHDARSSSPGGDGTSLFSAFHPQSVAGGKVLHEVVQPSLNNTLLGQSNSEAKPAESKAVEGALFEGLRVLMASKDVKASLQGGLDSFTPRESLVGLSAPGLDPASRPLGAQAMPGSLSRKPSLLHKPSLARASSQRLLIGLQSTTSMRLPSSLSATMTQRHLAHEHGGDLAAGRVLAKREEEASRHRQLLASLARLIHCVRVVLVASPDQAETVSLSAPCLAARLSRLTLPTPTTQQQEAAAVAEVSTATHGTKASLLDTCTAIHPHELVQAQTTYSQPSPAALFASKAMATAALASAHEVSDGREGGPDGSSTGAAGQQVQAELPADPQLPIMHSSSPQVHQTLLAAAHGARALQDSTASPTRLVQGSPVAAAPEAGCWDSPGLGVPSLPAPSLAGSSVDTAAGRLPGLHGTGGVASKVVAAGQVISAQRSHQAAALAQVLVALHKQAEQLLWEQGLLAPKAQLPFVKVADMMEVLARLHGAQLKLLRAQQSALWMSLQKLSMGHAHTVRAAGDLQQLQQATDARSQQVVDAQHKLRVLSSYEGQVARELQTQSALVEQHNTVVTAVTEEIDAALDSAQRRYRQALQEVSGLTENDLAELRSYTHPPERVRMVLMAVATLFELPTDWRAAQKLLGEQNPKLLERLVNFQTSGLSVVTLAKVSRIIAEPEFNIVQVESHSRAAKPLCWWVLSVVELLRAGRQADLKRSKIAEAEERLGAARKYVQQLRGELQAARNETARQRA
ncbi:hypothetical protein QJQ45_019324, partial [Haematococcus lacustris]